MRLHGDADAHPHAAPCRVLVIGADTATFDLLALWLCEAGCRVADEREAGLDPSASWDLIVADVPFPKATDAVLRRVAAAHPGVPVLAVSATFLPGVERSGETARALGVAGVLGKPLQRGALLATVAKLTGDEP